MNLCHLRICLLSIQISFPLLANAGAVTPGVPTTVVVKTVVVNKSALLDLENPARYLMIADKDIIYLPDPLKRKQLLISGKKIGSTDLIVWEENIDKPTFFEIHVVDDQDIIEAKIREYAPHAAIKVQYARDDTVILWGTAANELTIKKAEEIAKGYRVKVLNRITIDTPSQVPVVEDIIEAKIREYAPSDTIKVQYARDTVVLSGTVTNELTGRKAEEIAKAYAAKVLNHITIDTPLQVLLQVKVAQVDKTSLKRLGISAIVKGTKAEGFSNIVGAPTTATTTSTSGGATTTSSVNGTPGINGNGPGLGSFNPLDAFQVGVSYFPALRV